MLSNDNIYTSDEFLEIRRQIRVQNQKLVFTNGCFDILHVGHVDYLNKAKENSPEKYSEKVSKLLSRIEVE